MGQASRYGSFLISVAIGQCRVHAQEPITPTPNQEGMGVGILLHHVLDAQFGAYLCICSRSVQSLFKNLVPVNGSIY